MHIDLLTLFPETFSSYLDQMPVRGAIRNGLLQVRTYNFCYWADAEHPVVERRWTPRGCSKVLSADPIVACVEAISRSAGAGSHIVLLTPLGRMFNQAVAREFADCPRLLLVCGRFAGFDRQLQELLDADEVCVGKYVLNSGEVAAMTVMDALIRLIPGALPQAADSFVSY